MSEVLVVMPCCNRSLLGNVSKLGLLGGGSGGGEWKHMVVATNWHCHRMRSRIHQKLKPMMIVKGKMANPSTTYTSGISTNIPLYEVPWASFDQYLDDKPRVFRAMFPDKHRSQQLNEEEWRIHMLPIDFLFLIVRPVVDMRIRCKSQGIDYPPEVPLDITRVIELEIIRWKLDGADELKQSHFSLAISGVLYPSRRGPRSRLIGRLQMSISFIQPAIFSLVPEGVRQEIAKDVIKRLMNNMKNKVNSSLIDDYNKFKRERSAKLV